MADATQELMLRVRGDNSGADKAIAGTKTAVEGLRISGEKASGAFKNFSRSLAEARDASDVAASAANSLSNIVGKSLMGAFAVGGVKLFTDQINRMGESVKAVATEAQQAFDNIEKAGQAMSLSEAMGQVSQLDALLASTGKKLSELDRSPFQNFIAGATGARVAMEELVGTSQKLRDIKLAEGMATENANAEFTAGLDEQALQIAKVNAEYEKRSRIAQTFTDKEAYRIYQEASAAQKVRETNAIIDKMAEKAAQENEKNTQEKIKLDQQFAEQSQKNLEQQIKAEKELAEAQQKRFNDLYDAEIKAQEATQKRIDANNEAEKKAVSLSKDVSTAKQEQLQQVGGSALEITKAGTGGSARTGGRETSFEMGMRLAGERAYSQGQRIEADRVKQETANRINAENAARGETRRVQPESVEVQSRLKEQFVKQRGAEGEASSGTKQAREATVQATQASSDFAKRQYEAIQASSSFKSNLSDMGTGFDQAMKSAENFAGGMVENGGNMVDQFLKAGQQSGNLGDKIGDATDSVNKFSEELKKATTAGGAGAGQGKETGSLSSIEKLLQKNFDELKAYAHAT